MGPPQWLSPQRRPRSPVATHRLTRLALTTCKTCLHASPNGCSLRACRIRRENRSVVPSKRSRPKIRRFRTYTPHLFLHLSAGKGRGVRRHPKGIVVCLLPRGEKNRHPPCSRSAVGPQACYHARGVAGAASDLIPPHALKRGMGIGMSGGTPHGSGHSPRPCVVPTPSWPVGPTSGKPVGSRRVQ